MTSVRDAGSINSLLAACLRATSDRSDERPPAAATVTLDSHLDTADGISDGAERAISQSAMAGRRGHATTTLQACTG